MLTDKDMTTRAAVVIGVYEGKSGDWIRRFLALDFLSLNATPFITLWCYALSFVSSPQTQSSHVEILIP